MQYGSSLIANVKFRDNFVMIGQKGLAQGRAIEQVLVVFCCMYLLCEPQEHAALFSARALVFLIDFYHLCTIEYSPKQFYNA